MATLSALENALVNAHQAGDTEAARRLAAVVNQERERRSNDPSIQQLEQLPDRSPTHVPGTEVAPPEPTFTDQARGVLEAGATMATGVTGGLLGQIEGSVEGLVREIASGEFGTPEAARRVQELAAQRSQQLTYAPESELGQEYVQGVGETLAPLAAIPVMAETQLMASAARNIPARQIAQERVIQPAARVAQERVIQPAQQLVQKVKERLPGNAATGTGPESTAGAAAVEQGALRQSLADELPVPIRLTEGQKTREFEAQRFEQETAKMPEEGAPIRERFEDQNLQMTQNFDEFIDATGAEITSTRGIGELVDKALRSRAAKDKVRIRSLYKDAEKSGEMEAPVSLGSLVKHIEDSAPEAEVANVLKAVRSKAIQLGAAVEGPEGQLISKPVTLKNAELLRKSINASTNAEPTNIRQASIMKGLIDDTTEGAGGDAYKKARGARTKYAKEYENVSLVKNLLGMKKGTEDRAIALEDVLRKSILDPATSKDSVHTLRRLLQTSGDDGVQAWKELQGGTLRHIQEQMTKGVATNQRGDRIVSASQLDRVITQLEKSGKLEFIFGKKGAEQLETINEVAKVVLTSPPGTVNTSNTATVLAGLMDVAMTGMTGVPAPIATGFRMITGSIKDAKLKARIKHTLGD